MEPERVSGSCWPRGLFVNFFVCLFIFLRNLSSLCGRFVAFARPFCRFCCQLSLNRRHSAAVLRHRWFCLFCSWAPPGCLWLLRWSPEGVPPPTYGSQKLLMVFFSYCKRNKTGWPPQWSQKGFLAPAGCSWLSGLFLAGLGCCGLHWGCYRY